MATPSEGVNQPIALRAKLGGTRYSLVRSSSHGTDAVEVIRINRDGHKSIHIPEDLLIQYAKLWFLRQLTKLPDLLAGTPDP